MARLRRSAAPLHTDRVVHRREDRRHDTQRDRRSRRTGDRQRRVGELFRRARHPPDSRTRLRAGRRNRAQRTSGRRHQLPTLEGSFPRSARHCGRDADAERRPSHDRGRGAAGLLRHVCRLQVSVLGPGVDAGDLRSRRLQARRPRRSMDRRLREAQAWRNGAAGAGRDLRGRQAARRRVSRDEPWSGHPVGAGVAVAIQSDGGASADARHRARRGHVSAAHRVRECRQSFAPEVVRAAPRDDDSARGGRRPPEARPAAPHGRIDLVGLCGGRWPRRRVLVPQRARSVVPAARRHRAAPAGGARLAGARAERRHLSGCDAALRARAGAADEQNRSRGRVEVGIRRRGRWARESVGAFEPRPHSGLDEFRAAGRRRPRHSQPRADAHRQPGVFIRRRAGHGNRRRLRRL